MAVSHARNTARDHVRPDGSTYHVVEYSARTGAVLSRHTHQGYSDSSTWARGQAWAVHGFTMAYRETGEALFLDTARRTADYFLAHLPADHVPYWDLDLPSLDGEPRDTSAAAIAASGLVELAGLEPDRRASRRYRAAATDILASLSSPAYLAADTDRGAILRHGTQHKPDGNFDTGLIFGDYFFLEALLRWTAQPAR
jgi:unsaturated chondroitin disaccharide hydrolase